jgi:Ca2+-binding RTX toxin-like protein
MATPLIIVPTYEGDDGPNTFVGTKLKNYIIGHGGGDTFYAGAGNDTIVEQSNGSVVDYDHPNLIFAGEGNDAVYVSGTSVSVADLGSGSNLYIGTDLGGDNTILGGSGRDKIYVYVTGEDSITYINAGAGDDYVFVHNASISGFVLAYGGTGNDTMSSDGSGPVELNGQDGNDTLRGGAFSDRLIGGEGDNYLDGKGGNDDVLGGNGNDHALGGAGNDIVSGFGGNDTLEGGTGDDQLYGGSGRNTILTGSGNDSVHVDGDDFVLVEGSASDQKWITVSSGASAQVSDLNARIANITFSGDLSHSNFNIEGLHYTGFKVLADGTYDFFGGNFYSGKYHDLFVHFTPGTDVPLDFVHYMADPHG